MCVGVSCCTPGERQGTAASAEACGCGDEEVGEGLKTPFSGLIGERSYVVVKSMGEFGNSCEVA